MLLLAKLPNTVAVEGVAALLRDQVDADAAGRQLRGNAGVVDRQLLERGGIRSGGAAVAAADEGVDRHPVLHDALRVELAAVHDHAVGGLETGGSADVLLRHAAAHRNARDEDGDVVLALGRRDRVHDLRVEDPLAARVLQVD